MKNLLFGEHPYTAAIDGSERLLGATSIEEQAFCRWYGENGLTGKGVAVEFGPWLGSLSIPLLRGMAANGKLPDSLRVLHSFDRFTWDPGFDPWVAGTQYEGLFRADDDFQPLFERLTAPHCASAKIVVHRDDLVVASWAGEPIELMINDAWKMPAIMANVVHRFFPSLTEGALVFHQDYLWSSDSFIHIGMYLLRDYFDFTGRVKNSCTALFRRVRNIPPPVLTELASRRDFSRFTEDEVNRAFDWSRELFDEPEARLVVEAGRAWMLLQLGNPGGAKKIFAAIRESPGYEHPFYQFQEGILKSWGLAPIIG